MRAACALSLVALLLLSGCPGAKGEPPPPVASATLPPAPPRATGALAAGRESAAPPSGVAVPEPESDEEDGQAPLMPAPVQVDDGGVPL